MCSNLESTKTRAAGVPVKPSKPELFGTFKNLQLAYIHEKLLHTMVGPYGEYTPKDAYDTLREAVDEQVAHSLRNGANQRQVLSTMLRTPWSAKVGGVATAFIENLKDTQRSMAKVMGGKNTTGDILTLYPSLFDQIDGLFPKAAPEKPPAITPGG
jgi:hypothetical protein